MNSEMYWCHRCETHRVTTPLQLCPVCLDRVAKEADAKLPFMSWSLRRMLWRA